MARMLGLSGGLPLVYIVYSRKKFLWRLFQTPGPTFLSAPIRSREKGTYYGTRDGEQDALAGQGGSAGETPRGSPGSGHIL